MVGETPPAANESVRVQVRAGAEQAQPEPLMPVAVIDGGRASVTLTTPLAGPEPMFDTVIVYVCPVAPCVKLPECETETVRSAGRQLLTRIETLPEPPL